MSLESFLEELADETEQMPDLEMVQLSDLTPDEVEVVKRAWGDISTERRREIVGRLVQQADESVQLDFSAVFTMCLQDPDEEVREQAVVGLWECEDRMLVQPLIKLLREDPSPRVQAAAAEALGRFAFLAEEGKILQRDGRRIYEAFLEMLTSEATADEVQSRSLEGIAFFAQDSQAQGFIELAYQHPDSLRQRSAVVAMGRNGDPKWLSIILKELSSEDLEMRIEAARASGDLGEEAAVPYLVRLLQEDDLTVQVAVLDALSRIGGRAAKRAIQECLRNGDIALQDQAELALSQMDFEEDPLRPRRIF